MLKKSVKSPLANFKEMSINKFIAFKMSFFSFPSSTAHFLSFSSSVSRSFSVPCHCTQGNRIFYCTGKALSVPHEGRLEVEFPLPFRQKEGQTDHVIYYTRTRKHAESIKYLHTLNILSHRVDTAS